MRPIPQAPFNHLQALWFQLTGTLCNLECSHCFIACGPTNQRLKFLSPDTVYAYLEEATQLGVKEVYLTGGEPFLHKQIVPILTHALTVAPTTVLTNGTLITPAMADILAASEAESRYALEIRISLDDVDESNNDAVRGRGALAKALRALKLLNARGMTPIVAVTEYFYASVAPSEPSGMGSGFYQKFRDFLLANGIDKPRLKVIPVFSIGKMENSKPMASFVTPQMLHGFDFTTLQCTPVAYGGGWRCVCLPAARR